MIYVYINSYSNNHSHNNSAFDTHLDASVVKTCETAQQKSTTMSTNSGNQQAVYKPKKGYICYIHLKITKKKQNVMQYVQRLNESGVKRTHMYMVLLRTSEGIWEHGMLPKKIL